MEPPRRLRQADGRPGDNTFEDPEPFFEGDGLTFLNAGTDLISCRCPSLYKFTATRARSPGRSAWALPAREGTPSQDRPGRGPAQQAGPAAATLSDGPPTRRGNYGDRAENQFGAEFGEVAREGYMIRSPGTLLRG